MTSINTNGTDTNGTDINFDNGEKIWTELLSLVDSDVTQWVYSNWMYIVATLLLVFVLLAMIILLVNSKRRGRGRDNRKSQDEMRTNKHTDAGREFKMSFLSRFNSTEEHIYSN